MTTSSEPSERNIVIGMSLFKRLQCICYVFSFLFVRDILSGSAKLFFFMVTSCHWRYPYSRITQCQCIDLEYGYLLVGGKLESLQWRHNGCDSVSNHQPRECLLNRLIWWRSKKTSTLCVTGLCVGISPGTGEFPEPIASNAENVSTSWRHHENKNKTKQSTATVYWGMFNKKMSYFQTSAQPPAKQ